MGELRLWMLGGFRVQAGGRLIGETEWRRSGATALVKLLALQPGHRLHREQVIDTLWPSLDLNAGTTRLDKALHFARKALGADHLPLRNDLLCLAGSPLWTDVEAFEAAAADGQVEAALALYAGELLPENRFEPWAGPRRDQIRGTAVRLLLERGIDRESRGDGRAAIAALERLIELDPLHEAAYVRLMRLEALDGHRHVALRWYDTLAERLAEELGVEPHADTRRLHGEIAAGLLGPPAPVRQPPPGEERKLVTVLAADLRGLPGDADPENSRRDTAMWTEALTEVITRWGGTAERVIGGGLVAIFGYPAACEDHATRALSAGSEILQRIAVPVRIGVDTGEVIVPDLGGEVLDGAARLREAAEPRNLLASERTRRAARRHADFEPPFVGRDAEIGAVSSLIDEAARSRRPRLLTVVGAAGVGKSRLVRELIAATVRRRPDVRVLSGRCLAAGDGITYWALGEILRDACGITLADSGKLAERKLRRLLSTLSEVDDTRFALAATAAIRLPGNPLDAASPRQVADDLALAWPRFVTALSARGPLILVVEDLHWAGAPMLTMLARLAARSSGPVVLLTTARPEFLHEHPALAEMSVISLPSLADGPSRELLAGLPRAAGLEPARREEILVRADGNPYFLEQLAAHIADGAAGVLPDTIHALLAARVDALPAMEKRLLQEASVMGRTFWADPLKGLLGPELAEPLAALEDRGLIQARSTDYAFRHALLRDVAYASLPLTQRARGHAEAAAWLEEFARDRVAEVIELIAFHYAAAASGGASVQPDRGEWWRAKAFRALIEAGVGARRRYAVAKALELHQQALHHAAGAGERAEALAAIGDDHEVAFAGDAAVNSWRAATELLRREAIHPDRRAALCVKAAQMVVVRWGGFRTPPDPALADEFIDEGLSVVDDPAGRALLLSMRANCGARWAWTGRPDPMPVAVRRDAAQAAGELAAKLDSPNLRAQALRGLAAVHFLEGGYDRAVQTVLDEVEFRKQGSLPRDRAWALLIASALVSDVSGAPDLALTHARSSYELALELSAHERMHATYQLMWVLAHLGRWPEAEPYLAEHLELFNGPETAMSCPYLRGGPLLGAIAAARLGQADRARELAALVPPDLECPGKAEALHAQLAIELGDLAGGRALAEHLVRLNRRPGPEEIPHELLVLVDALVAQGDLDALRQRVPAARSDGGYLALMEPTCDRAEALIRLASGDTAAATELFARAVAGFERLSAPLQVERTLEYQIAASSGGRTRSTRKSGTRRG